VRRERCKRVRIYRVAKTWLIPNLACALPRAERETVALGRLYFVGYVTVYPRHCANVSSASARLSPTPIAQRRTQVALRGTAPPSSSCFVQENQDARYLPECVRWRSANFAMTEFSEVRRERSSRAVLLALGADVGALLCFVLLGGALRDPHERHLQRCPQRRQHERKSPDRHGQ
jgi:hypothetical protein